MVREAGKFILLVVLLCSGLLVKAQDNIIDQIIWVVGDEAILKSDVEKARAMILSRGERIDGDPYCLIPEQLAVQKLFLDQAKIDSIDVPAAEVSRGVTRQENMVISNLGSKEKAEEYLQAPMSQLREEWREEIRNNYLVSEVKKNLVGKKSKLTPSEVRRYYAQLPQDSLPYIPTTVEVQIITNEPVVPLEEIDKVKERLRDFTNRINAGESFATLAIMYSEDGSAQNGGELGFSGRANWVTEFSNMAFSLNDPKKVSNIVETEYGFHIMQLIERRGDLINVRHILLKPKVPDVEFNKVIAKMDSITQDIKQGKFTFEDATVLSFDKNTRKNNGLMVNRRESSNYGTPRFLKEELPPAVAIAVEKLKVGEVSSPFRMKGDDGKEVVAIVKLKSRIEGHIANVSDDYQALKEIVEEKKHEEILRKWLQNKIKDTYVLIDENWRNCDFQYSGWIKEEGLKK
ncbi:peptidylprolyl isomerase [Dysgonomonas sp. Marseille-P4677]|uniref:peptidylprolyl isomerase n=1 Tax=Dysgonomonas sp. Marseille-P4677 TaxID=2364790 RepID=UPI0019122B49|nr:peptidylprolyl isomerase [Dysgonomonas sp. Marseille-P4677]MBK5719628.1 peptidylprolyl isomerase [Dysgonomonas sp. Marseille-P4677]